MLDWSRFLRVLFIENTLRGVNGEPPRVDCILNWRLSSRYVKEWFDVHLEAVIGTYVRGLSRMPSRTRLVHFMKTYDMATVSMYVVALQKRGLLQSLQTWGHNPLAVAAYRGAPEPVVEALYEASQDADLAPAIAVATDHQCAVFFMDRLLESDAPRVYYSKNRASLLASAVLSCQSLSAEEKFECLQLMQLDDGAISCFFRIVRVCIENPEFDLEWRGLHAAGGSMVYVNYTDYAASLVHAVAEQKS